MEFVTQMDIALSPDHFLLIYFCPVPLILWGQARALRVCVGGHRFSGESFCLHMNSRLRGGLGKSFGGPEIPSSCMKERGRLEHWFSGFYQHT